MRRRDVIVGLGAGALWPLSAHTQQSERSRRIGIVAGFTEGEMPPLEGAFREKLNSLGWKEGANIIIDVRLGGGDYKRMGEDAGRLVGLRPDVIVAQGTPGVVAVRQHSLTVPVVFIMVADPVRTGLVASLARPGGYATGFTNFEFPIGGKWLELLREVFPSLENVTLISHPGNPTARQFAQHIEDVGRAIAINVKTASVHNPSEIEAAIVAAAHPPRSGLIIFPDSLVAVHRDRIIALAARHQLPAVYPFRFFASDGGLLSYGLDFPELYRQAAAYVDRILRGEKPADLPVQAPTKLELVINLKTAKALGLTIPPSLLIRADEVIE
jgi:putative ABC transport system substrate-binding protein